MLLGLLSNHSILKSFPKHFVVLYYIIGTYYMVTYTHMYFHSFLKAYDPFMEEDQGGGIEI